MDLQEDCVNVCAADKLACENSLSKENSDSSQMSSQSIATTIDDNLSKKNDCVDEELHGDTIDLSGKNLSKMAESCDKKVVLELPTFLKDKLKNEIPEVFVFITNLQNCIEKQKKKLKKLKSKLKKKVKSCTIATQTDNCVIYKEEAQPKSLVEEIKEAAAQAVQKTGFVYEETSGLYYDYNTGYYYNAEYGLYYEAKSGTYMTYNAEKQTYEFHSQVEVPISQENENNCGKNIPPSKRKSKNEGDKQGTKRKRPSRKNSSSSEATNLDLEEGECSEDNSIEDEVTSTISEEDDVKDDVSNQWPCMRIIVEESNVSTLKIGSLHIVTFEGGTLGREGKHDILVPDINVSKHHLRITFDKEAKEFKAVDLGSRNGTFLNGKRMSSSKQESDPLAVVHGSRLQIGSVTLLCHVHIGNQTCGHCEPGLIQRPDEKPVKPLYNKSKEYKKELQKLKKKFAVNFEEESNKKVAAGYQDRAQTRRETVGSQNPHEKTEMASVHENISTQNKGFKMLSKLGWSEGQTLGKDSSKGLLEPIPLVSNFGTAGLGSGGMADASNPIKSDVNKATSSNKEKLMKITQERFDKTPTLNDVDTDY